MSKLRVHDMAGEFGVSSDDVITILRQMEVPVRSHLSPLSDDQVARVRARWEREKRARADKPAAAPSRRRRGAAKPAAGESTSRAKTKAPDVARAAPAEDDQPSVRRRRRRPAAEVAAAQEAAELATAEKATAVAKAAADAAPADSARAAEDSEASAPRPVRRRAGARPSG
ncbi:MAG: translation initiation factor IF-2 N-terminal domain-containing protein, partial [Gemmatimonadaceae bacterium]